MKNFKFIIGEIYETQHGKFEIVSIDEKKDKLQILWEGEIEKKEVELSSMKKVIHFCKLNTEAIERNKEKNIEIETYSNKKYYFTIGYLSKHCKIIARVRPTTENKFANEYMAIKGKYPFEESGYGVDTCVTTWGNVIRVIFNTKNLNSIDIFSFPSDPIVGSLEDELIINNLKWGMELLTLGFEIGGNHNIKEIQENVPIQYMEDFKKGLTYNL